MAANASDTPTAVHQPGPGRATRALKRALDVSLSLAMLAASAPVWLVVPLAIVLEDGRPVFYRQTRWGRSARRFRVLKFRTMVAHSDREFGIIPAAARDPRVTRIGAVLRATGLDELPQLVNILRGDMSLVGPRALAVGEVVLDAKGSRVDYESTPGFRTRLLVRPGLTGLATIYLPKDVDVQEKFAYDERYVNEIGFWLDVRLIVLSVWISLAGRWERRDGKLRRKDAAGGRSR